MERLKIGQANSVTWVAEKKYCVERGEDLWVFSTPSLVWLMERACANMLIPVQSEDQTSVGTFVSMRHLAPSGLGAALTGNATLVEMDRRRFWFKVSIFDGAGKVGEGEHERFIVNTDKYEERIRSRHH